MDIRYAKRAEKLIGSAVRNPLFNQPGLISFAAGKPEGKLFPNKELIKTAKEVLETYPETALQYSDTEGLPEIREIIAKQRMGSAGVKAESENITLVSGSQEGIEMAGKLFVDYGDTIIVEDPSYVGVYNAWQIYGPNYIGVPMEDDGMNVDELEQVLKLHPEAKMIYTIPDFQNPTGHVMSNEKRVRLAGIAAKYKIPVIEDSPYGDLYYSGERHPAVQSFDKDGWVIYLGSFSKIFCPGFRIGWVCACPEIVQKFSLLKQGSNLQCSTLDELLAVGYMTEYDMQVHINEVRDLYRQRRDLMLECIEQFFPKGVKHTSPEGGFFIWVELKEDIDANALLVESCIHAKVGFIPGEGFFCSPGRKNYIRLSYSFVNLDEIRAGMERLGHLLKKYYE